MGTPGILRGWAFDILGLALQGHSRVGHSRDTEGWTLQGYSEFGHSKHHFGDILGLGNSGILRSWALQKSLQGYPKIGHQSGVGLGTPEILRGWVFEFGTGGSQKLPEDQAETRRGVVAEFKI